MLISQLSVFVENKSGRMAEITKVLADNQIDIRALSIADTTDYGILRLIVDKPELAMRTLQDEGMTVTLTDVIAIKIPDSPGGLHGAVDILSQNGIGIEYMYAFVNPCGDSAFVILRVDDNQRALSVLKENGIEVMKRDEVYSI